MKFRLIVLAAALVGGISLAQAQDGAAPYKASADGKKVDAKTYAGYSTYTNSCVTCHGREGTGGMGGGKDILAYLKTASKDDFKSTVLNGRPGTQMVAFKTVAPVADNVDAIYAYMKGRADGKIARGSLDKLE